MSKNPRKKKKKPHSQPRSVLVKKKPKYSPGEIALAILGAAIVIMIAVIIITSFLE